MVETRSVIRSRMAKSPMAATAQKQKRKHQSCDVSVKTSRTKTTRFEVALNPPPGYIFVPKGDRYVTRHCNMLGLTQDAFIPESSTRIGLYVPKDVYLQVQAMAAATTEKRRAIVKRKDEHDMAQATLTMIKVFPQAPAKEIESAVKQAYLKSSGRVGRSSSLTAEKKATLAMIAHIRHSKTLYDRFLRTGVARSEARERVEQVVNQTVDFWQGKHRRAAIVAETTKEAPGDRAIVVAPPPKLRSQGTVARDRGAQTAITESIHKYIRAAAVSRSTKETPVKRNVIVSPPLVSRSQDKVPNHQTAQGGMAKSTGEVAIVAQTRNLHVELEMIAKRNRRRIRKLKPKMASELGRAK